VTGPRFFADALAEYEDAVVYYEKREEGLGARLIKEFDEAVAVALEYTGTARDEEGGDGIRFSKNFRLVRGKVASRKELSHQR
jgi:hypothetical protein